MVPIVLKCNFVCLASIIGINFWSRFCCKIGDSTVQHPIRRPFLFAGSSSLRPLPSAITGQQWRQWQIYSTLTRTAHGANTWHTQSIDPPTSAHLSTATVAECRARSSSCCCRRRRRRWRRGPMTTEARVPPAGSSTCVRCEDLTGRAEVKSSPRKRKRIGGATSSLSSSSSLIGSI